MKIDNIEIMNFEGAMRGMRNPYDSWDKSDSLWYLSAIIKDERIGIGEKDIELAQRLLYAGTEHAKFMRQIFVSMDIAAPLYWWSEMDTYKVGTTANSCSTMHTLAKYPIVESMFAFDKTNCPHEENFRKVLIEHLEYLRQKYNETKDYDYFRRLKQDLPTSFIQKRTWTGSYANLRNIISQRRNHRLSEWHDFINVLETFPYAEEFLFYNLKEIDNGN